MSVCNTQMFLEHSTVLRHGQCTNEARAKAPTRQVSTVAVSVDLAFIIVDCYSAANLLTITRLIEIVKL